MINISKVLSMGVFFILCSLTPIILADQSSDAPHFIFILKAKNMSVTSLADGKLSVTLYDIAPKTLYMIYPPVNQAGIVHTQDLIDRWKNWGGQKKWPLLVTLKTGKGEPVVVGMVPVKSIANNGWLFYATKPHDNALPEQYVDLKTGDFSNVEMASDTFPINIRSLPHTVCPLSMEESVCFAQSIK